MEQFNSKLYAKYQNLKKRKGYVEDELNDKVDADIRNYQLATEDLIAALKTENNRLRAEISSMQERYGDCQKLLLEESRKAKELSNEVGRLQNLLSQKNGELSIEAGRLQYLLPRKNGDRENVQLETPCTSPRVRTRSRSKSLSKRKSPKCSGNRSEAQHEEAPIVPYASYQEKQIVPDCCRRKTTSAGAASGGEHSSCVFQTLMEFLVGMKFSIDNQFEGLCLSVMHERSGYTFSLTWMEPETGGEGEFIYHVSSLGTLERVALDWMREDMVFSVTMCPVFFERISRLIGRH